MREYVYTVLTPGTKWSGVVGTPQQARVGVAVDGRVSGGVLEAETMDEAKAQIMILHGADTVITSLESRFAFREPN
jgi:hypothetical protein